MRDSRARRARRPAAAAARVVLAIATVAYPLGVYFGLGRFGPAWLGLALVGLMAARAWTARDPLWWFAAAGVALLALGSFLADSWLPLKLYPVLVSAVLLALFAGSLAYPPTVIERIARLREPALSPQGVAYTRKVTVAWCLFFVFNGAVAAGTALWAGNEAWLLYNGLISYVLMGLVFAGEWCIRQRSLPRAGSAGAVRG